MFSIQTKKIKSNEVFYFSHDLANFSLGIAIFFKTGREKGQVLHSYNILRFFGDTDLNQGGKFLASAIKIIKMEMPLIYIKNSIFVVNKRLNEF